MKSHALASAGNYCTTVLLFFGLTSGVTPSTASHYDLTYDEAVIEAYKDGYDQGEQRSTSIWKRSYKEDCYGIFAFSVEVQDQVIYGEYKKPTADESKNYNKWFNQGGRDGAQDKLKEYQMECLDPLYCDELGTTAAELIASDFCKIPSAFGSKDERTPVSMCRIAARRACQGKIWNMLEKVTTYEVNGGRCGGLPHDDLKKMSTEQLLHLQDECNEQVDTMIEWDEFDEEWSEHIDQHEHDSSKDDNSSSDYDVDTRSGCEDYDDEEYFHLPAIISSSIISKGWRDYSISSKSSKSSKGKGKKKKKNKRRYKSRKQRLRNRA